MRGLIWGCVALVAIASLPADAQEMPRPPIPPEGTLLEIAAEGHSTRVPDIAIIQAGVTTQAPTAAAALAQNNAQMARVTAALRAAGVAERDIQTANISLNPQYRSRTDGQPQEIFAYQASNSVTVRFRDVAKAGGIIDILVREGANTLSGPELVNSQPMEALNEARVDAVAKARARAELYANAAGLGVKRIIAIRESGGGYQPPQPMPMMAMARAEKADTVIEPGEQKLSVSLAVSFELE
jgi:uncharacterized protein YggE